MKIYFIYATFGNLKEAKRIGGQLVKKNWPPVQILYQLFIQPMFGKIKL